MFYPTLIMCVISLVLVAIGYLKGGSQHVDGLKISMHMLINTIPMLIFAFILAGMVQVLLPKELILKWIGKESGLRGIILGTIAGGFSPGGPYVGLPIVAGLLQAGASVGVLVAFLTSWSLWAFARLPMEFAIIGYKLTLIRLASTFFFPPIAGLIAQYIFERGQ